MMGMLQVIMEYKIIGLLNFLKLELYFGRNLLVVAV